MGEYNRAWIKVGQLRYDDEVVADLQNIIQKDKTFYRAYRSLAEVYSKRHEAEAGERYFRELAARDPANELAHYGLGEVLRLRGELEEAAKEYRACASMNPRSYACQDGVREYGFFGLGHADLSHQGTKGGRKSREITAGTLSEEERESIAQHIRLCGVCDHVT